MDEVAGDSTRDWLLPDAARPPLIGEIERRVEEALATARASEAAVMTVGAAALDAAEQARRAAELAERASAAAADARDRAVAVRVPSVPGAVPVAAVPPGGPLAAAAGGPGGAGLGDFSERADRLVARLRQLQRVPLAGPAASDAAVPPRPTR